MSHVTDIVLITAIEDSGISDLSATRYGRLVTPLAPTQDTAVQDGLRALRVMREKGLI